MRAVSVRPEPSRPCQADDLTATNTQIQGRDRAFPSEVFNLQKRFTLADAALTGILVFHRGDLLFVLAYHARDQLKARQVGGRIFTYKLAIAQHSNTICHGIDLIHEMRDENDPNAVVAQLADDFEKLSDPALVKAGGWLVESE